MSVHQCIATCGAMVGQRSCTHSDCRALFNVYPPLKLHVSDRQGERLTKPLTVTVGHCSMRTSPGNCMSVTDREGAWQSHSQWLYGTVQCVPPLDTACLWQTGRGLDKATHSDCMALFNVYLPWKLHVCDRQGESLTKLFATYGKKKVGRERSKAVSSISRVWTSRHRQCFLTISCTPPLNSKISLTMGFAVAFNPHQAAHGFATWCELVGIKSQIYHSIIETSIRVAANAHLPISPT